MASLKAQISNALKSYKNGSKKLSTVIGLSVQFAQENSHNPVHIQTIMDGVDPQDATLVSTLVKAAGPFSVSDGVVKVTKAKKDKPREYNSALVERLVAGDVSFRTLAGELMGNKPEPKPFDAAKYAATVMKKLAKEGVELALFERELDKAAQEAKVKAAA